MQFQSHTEAVNEAFGLCLERGYLDRANLLVHWSPALQSVLSDIEVDRVEISEGRKFFEVPSGKALVGQMFDVRYQVVGSSEAVTVSTTRPETLLGDVAVAVHPDDHRYTDLLNRNVRLRHPLREDSLPLVADRHGVDPELGTGAVKITPHHDHNDFEVGQRLGLPGLTIMDEEGLICFPASESRFKLTPDGKSFVVSSAFCDLF